MLRLILIALVLLITTSTFAQNVTEPLSRCLAENTSGKDRKDLAKWIYFAMSEHPDMKRYAATGASLARDESQKTAAAIFTRLLADQCAKEASQAVKIGGTLAIQSAFSTLGQLAMQELMSDKDVAAGMSSFQKYLDQDRINQALSQK